MVENPFKYGGVVRGAYFADRENELRELTNEIKSGINVFLISPRRFGKTCLLFNLMDRLQETDITSAYFDLNAHPDLSSLAGAVAAETSRALESNADKLAKVLSGLQYLRPRMTVGPDGTVGMGMEVVRGDVEPLQALLEGLNHAEGLAARKNRRLVVVFDEFSDLLKYNGDTVEKALRSAMQQHEHISYVLSGSEQSVMLSMVQERRRPFYKMGRLMELGPIPREEYSAFIAEWLSKGGLSYPTGGVERILNLGNDIPYNIQRLCHLMWERAVEVREVTPENIEELPDQIVRQDSPFYEMLWQNATQSQRVLLIALSEDPDLSPLSSEFILKHQLGSPSSIQASLRSVVNKGILYRDREGKYRFTDSFMPVWIISIRRDKR